MVLERCYQAAGYLWITFHLMKRKVTRLKGKGISNNFRELAQVLLMAPVFAFAYCLICAYTASNQVHNWLIFKIQWYFWKRHAILNEIEYTITFSAWHVHALRRKQLCLISVRSNCKARDIEGHLDHINRCTFPSTVVFLSGAYQVLCWLSI